MDDNHDFELTYRLINDKINKKAVLTYKEQEFYFEGTKKECRQNVILLPQMKEYAFFVFYNIYLTDTNSEINKMSKIHSSDTPIREVYGINLKHYELLELLIIYVNEFKREVLENNNLYKENNNLKNTIKREFKKVLNQLTEEKIIAGVKVKGFKDDIFYTSESNIEALANIKLNNMIHILSPFDNLIIQRKRIKDLFDFDYQLECYLPQNKRKFGYFCLPVLCGSRFIARIDAKASRADNIFLVKNMFQDKDFKNSAYSKKLLKKTAQLANFTSCAEVKGM